MALTVSQIENLLVKSKCKSSLAELMIAYSALKQKIECTENHSWYFKQGIESKREELSTLKNHFEKMRKVFNASSIDSLIYKLNENNSYLSASKEKYKGANQRILCSWKSNDNIHLNEFIRLKSKMASVRPIDYYLENPKALMKFID